MPQYIFRAALLMLFVFGCRSENELVKLEDPVDIMTEENPKTDVLLVLDNSCSMQEDWAYITYGLTQIPVELNHHNFDWKLGIISMDSSDGFMLELDPSVPDPGWEMIGLLDYFKSQAGELEEGFLSALTIKTINSNWFRPGVVTTILFITDEKEQSNISATDFHSRWLDPHIVASMVGPDQVVEGLYPCAEVAIEYHLVSDFTFDICASQRWSLVEKLIE